jgi:hypothetical protein
MVRDARLCRASPDGQASLHTAIDRAGAAAARMCFFSFGGGNR